MPAKPKVTVSNNTSSPVNVIDNEDLYNAIALDGLTSPGRVTLSGHNRAIKWDSPNGPFSAGATSRLPSMPIVEFSASFYLVKDPSQNVDDYAEWPAFLRKLRSCYAANGTPVALDIHHPDLVELGINAVLTTEIGGRTYDGKGGCTIVVKFKEYRPARKFDGLPAVKPTVDPNAGLKREVATLTPIVQLLYRGKDTPWG